MTDYWKNSITYRQSRQARRTLKANIFLWLFESSCLSSSHICNFLLKTVGTVQLNIHRHVKYRAVQCTHQAVFTETRKQNVWEVGQMGHISQLNPEQLNIKECNGCTVYLLLFFLNTATMNTLHQLVWMPSLSCSGDSLA